MMDVFYDRKCSATALHVPVAAVATNALPHGLLRLLMYIHQGAPVI